MKLKCHPSPCPQWGHVHMCGLVFPKNFHNFHYHLFCFLLDPTHDRHDFLLQSVEQKHFQDKIHLPLRQMFQWRDTEKGLFPQLSTKQVWVTSSNKSIAMPEMRQFPNGLSETRYSQSMCKYELNRICIKYELAENEGSSSSQERSTVSAGNVLIYCAVFLQSLHIIVFSKYALTSQNTQKIDFNFHTSHCSRNNV